MNTIIILLAVASFMAFLLGKQGNKKAKFAAPFLIITVTICSVINVFTADYDGRQENGLPLQRRTLAGQHQGQLLAQKWPQSRNGRLLILTFKVDEGNKQTYDSFKAGLQLAMPECEIEFYDTGICPKKQRLKSGELQQLQQMDWDICLSMVGFPVNTRKLGEDCMFNPSVRGERKFVVLDGEEEKMQELLEAQLIDMYFTRDYSKAVNAADAKKAISL